MNVLKAEKIIIKKKNCVNILVFVSVRQTAIRCKESE